MCCNIKNFFEIFYYFFGGIGLLFAGIGGFKVLLNWVADLKEQKKLKKRILSLKSKYPLENLDKDFKLVKGDQDKRKVFIYDIDNKEKRWISSPETLRALDFDFHMITTLLQKEIDSIKEGDEIHIN